MTRSQRLGDLIRAVSIVEEEAKLIVEEEPMLELDDKKISKL